MSRIIKIPNYRDYSLDIVGDLYAAAVRADLKTYEPPAIPAIQDSLFTVRSLAFSTALQNNRLVGIFDDLLRQQPSFDHSFVFTASAEARQARLRQRTVNEPHKLTKIDQILIAEPELATSVSSIIVGLMKEAFGATLIDTTDLSIAAASRLIRETVERK